MTLSESNVLISSFSNLFVSQVNSRLISFFFNYFTAKKLTPREYGLGFFQLAIINTMVLQLSREGFRRGCLRAGQSSTRRLLATSSLVIPFGVLVTVAVCWIWLTIFTEDYEGYQFAVVIQGIAAVIEICSEPFYILAQTNYRFSLRTKVETTATLGKSGFILGALILRTKDLCLAWVFGIAQVVYAAVFLVWYSLDFVYFHFGHNSTVTQAGGQDTGSKTHGDPLLDASLLKVCGSFSAQAAVKLILGHGSELVMVSYRDTDAQGIYTFVTNLGSLVVRTVFQPFEEAVFTSFSVESQADAGPTAASSAKLDQQRVLISAASRCITSLGLLAASFGPAYSYLVLRLLYGTTWSSSDAPTALSMYSVVLPVLASNGVLEAFVHAVANAKQITQSNLLLVLFSGAHVGTSVMLVRAFGVLGLFGADAANMLLRITYCIVFMRGYFRPLHGFTGNSLMPCGRVLMSLLAAAAITGTSNFWLMGSLPQVDDFMQSILPSGVISVYVRYAFWCRALCHVGVGLVALAFVLWNLYKGESRSFSQLMSIKKSSVGKQE